MYLRKDDVSLHPMNRVPYREQINKLNVRLGQQTKYLGIILNFLVDCLIPISLLITRLEKNFYFLHSDSEVPLVHYHK